MVKRLDPVLDECLNRGWMLFRGPDGPVLRILKSGTDVNLGNQECWDRLMDSRKFLEPPADKYSPIAPWWPPQFRAVDAAATAPWTPIPDGLRVGFPSEYTP